MFGKKDDVRTRAVTEERMPLARGGVSFGAILTGVVVAFGALTLLLALAGGILAATDTIDEVANVSGEDAVTAGAVAGIVLVIAWLFAYMWGGYTAGRMGRGAGFLNGLLVPIVAVLLLLAVGAIASALGAEAELNNPLDTVRLPIEESNLVDISTGIGIAVLVAMFFGSIIGGMLGARWHTKLERRVAEKHVVAGDHPHDDARAAEERRRLSERADVRRRTAATPDAAPLPAEQTTQPNEPVVTNHGTTTGAQPVTPQTSARTVPGETQTTTEKPSIKDRLTGEGPAKR